MKHINNIKIAVCCLARDCEKNLQRNIRKLKKLSKYFQEVEFFVVENHSKDNTRAILERWQNTSKVKVHLPDVHEYHGTLHNIHAFDFYDKDEETLLNMHERYEDRLAVHFKDRVSRISLARDCYLHAIKKSDFMPDYILMCDIDIQNFSMKGLLDCFLSDEEWDVVTANGFAYHFTKQKMEKLFYDTFALEIEGKECPPHHIKDYLRDEMVPALEEEQWIPVLSAFGGIAIYSYASIFLSPTSYYIDAITEDNFSFCEHVSFHKLLRKKNFTKIYINPKLVVQYNTRINTIIDKVKKFLEKK